MRNGGNSGVRTRHDDDESEPLCSRRRPQDAFVKSSFFGGSSCLSSENRRGTAMTHRAQRIEFLLRRRTMFHSHARDTRITKEESLNVLRSAVALSSPSSATEALFAQSGATVAHALTSAGYAFHRQAIALSIVRGGDLVQAPASITETGHIFIFSNGLIA